MTNPEQALQQYLHGGYNSLQMLQDSTSKEFLSEVNERVKADSVTDLLNKRIAREDNNMTVHLEKEGNVESLKLPGNFVSTSVNKKDHFFQFASSDMNQTRVCYWRRSDFSADHEDTESINQVMKQPPHTLDEQEILDVMPMLAPGRPWGNGDYKELSLRSEDIGGRRVLVANFTFPEKDKQIHLIIANPDNDTHHIENIWLEGTKKDFEKNNKSILDALHQIKWIARK